MLSAHHALHTLFDDAIEWNQQKILNLDLKQIVKRIDQIFQQVWLSNNYINQIR